MSPDDDLERWLREFDQQIGQLKAEIAADSPSNRRERSILLGISAVTGIGGLIFAAPTSGLSLILAVPGLWLTARETMKDSQIANRAREAEKLISALEIKYAKVRAELERRHGGNPGR